ncbi:helix-turn-helix domain-containing protein [Bacillus alveayuensis]|jgi:putative transcriptional regulator|uniref:Transcriptional regulator n=1 Tax=Aeribacillus alveayuensis TaxID=279215 RepID=A0ABT9VN02_9BACI|nr:helix-turn-helix transcriptional regulator [Bacillus alveayuensis]MDQ0162105.1 putative transcriptional regulator [Bacillus alveayuensis]
MPKQFEIHIKLDHLLKQRRMTKRELARKADIRHTLVWEMCHNKTKRLPLDKLAKICSVLEVEIHDIIELVEKKKNAI